jgi:glycerol-3-phosphate dehydrogenase
MTYNINALISNKFDVLVIGGGVIGAGVALDAATRGLRTALIEKNDFASGTSSKSSKLIHGGLRYLNNYQFKTVFDCSREKTLLKHLAPHLIDSIDFILPYKSFKQRAKYCAGLWLYDTMAFDGVHKHLSLKNTVDLLDRNIDVDGSFVVRDAITTDYRLVMHLLNMAKCFGAVISNYTKADEILYNQDMKAVGVRSNGHIIQADTIVNCTGAWTTNAGDIKTIKSKGVHIFVDNKFIKHSMIIQSSDNRIIFCIVKDNGILIGTTDTKYTGNVNKVVPTDTDIKFLLENVNNYFNTKLSTYDVRYSFAGLRTLVDRGLETQNTSRDFEIVDNNMLSVIGGKMTTYRLIAKNVVDRITKTKCITNKLRLFPTNIQTRLHKTYGSLATGITLDKRFDDSDYFIDEIRHVVDNEMAVHLTDALIRRTGITYDYPLDKNPLVAPVAAEMYKLLNWDKKQLYKEIDDYYDYVSNYLISPAIRSTV